MSFPPPQSGQYLLECVFILSEFKKAAFVEFDGIELCLLRETTYEHVVNCSQEAKHHVGLYYH